MLPIWIWLKANAELLAQLVTIVGLPIAIFSYVRESRRQRNDRELGTYSSLDDKYIYYMNLCIEHPELNLFHVPLPDRPSYTPEQTVRRYAMFEILVSILERAFLMYSGHPTPARANQWAGWEAYLKFWVGHPDFDALWGMLGGEFDDRFVAHVQKLMNERRAA